MIKLRCRLWLACGACCLVGLIQSSANLITNGDFQAGAVGFGTDYSPAGIGVTEGTYAVVDNPHGSPPARNPSAASYFDHTFGTSDGLMLAVNGATTPGLAVWRQHLTGLLVGQQYVFTVWVSSWVAASDVGNAVLDIKMDGQWQTTIYAPAVAGIWEQRSFAWTAASSSLVFAAIYDTELAIYPNDFALDDLSLVPFSGDHDDQLGEWHPPTPVPEASTCIAGAMLAVIAAAHGIRSARKR